MSSNITQAFICDAIRTPFGRYGGALSSIRTDDLGAIPLRALMARNPQVDWAAVTDVFYGNANQAGEDNRNVAHMSSLLAGLPIDVPGATLNRLCGSGLDAVGSAYKIEREAQDRMALASQMKAVAAQKAGHLAREITAVTIPQKKGDAIVVDKDEHPRETSMESLAKLKGVVRPDGTVTAGNASGVNDGSCALLLANETLAGKYGLTPKARVVGMATAGVAPRVMGIGPAPATLKVLAQTGLSLDQIDVIELNEAFAAQGLAVLRMLGLKDDDERVNAWGGAIALGHPLGASGARLATTAVNRLHATGGRYALCTMCIGVGQGIAVILERV